MLRITLLRTCVRNIGKLYTVRCVPLRTLQTSSFYMKKMSEEFIPDEPIKYSASKAYDYRAFESFDPPKRDWPWYQSPIIIISISVLLLYFCVLREENDLDAEISKGLYERIPGLEERDLNTVIEYDKKLGKDVTALEARLKELVEEKAL